MASRAPRNLPTSRWLRALPVLIAALALAFVSLDDYLRWRAAQRRLETIGLESGLFDRQPDLPRRLRREPDPVQAGLELGTALLADELDPRWLKDLPPSRLDEERRLGLERLRTARDLAESGLARRPAAWRAALILGGGTYLERFRSRDARLLAESEAWERPLESAHRMAPGHPEPRRFLAAAYLGNWSALDAQKKTRATEVVREAFENDRTLTLLIEPWLRVAPSLRQSLEVLPDESLTWRRLQDFFARRADWERLCLARRRWLEALEIDLARRLEEARLRLRHGDRAEARRLLLEAISEAPPDLRFAGAVRESLERLPPGPVGPEPQRHFAAWLSWALDLCLHRSCPLPPHTIERLSRAARGTPATEALAALVAEDLPRAELFERRALTLLDADWGPYYIVKARRQASADPEGAMESLELVPVEWRKSALFWLGRSALASAGATGAGLAEAAARLEELRRWGWPAFAWHWQGDTARLEILPAGPAVALRLRVMAAPSTGAAVEVRWDGRAIDARPVVTGSTLHLELEISPEPHLLELVSLRGGEVRPGAVDLVPRQDDRSASRPPPPAAPPA